MHYHDKPITYGPLYASGSAVAHLNFTVLQDDGNFSLTARELEHLIELCLVFGNVEIGCSVLIGRPGLVGIGSTCLAVDNGIFFHGQSSFMLAEVRVEYPLLTNSYSLYSHINFIAGK